MCLLHLSLFFRKGDLCQTLVFLMLFVEIASFFDLKSMNIAFFRGVPFGTPFSGEVLEPILPKVGSKTSPQELPGEPLGSPWGDLESPCDPLGRLWEGFGHLVGLLGTPGEPF